MTPASRLNVLILEDNPSDADIAAAELRRSGYDLVWRRVDTEQEYLAQLALSPDIILADFSLPQFDAHRAISLLREQALDIPIIVVTGTLGDEAAVALIKEGAADYILKDRMARLGQAVAVALEQSRAKARLREDETQYAALLEAAPDALLIIDITRNIKLVNKQAEAMFGYKREELLGKPPEFLMPERFMRQHVEHRRQYQLAPRSRSMGTGLTMYGRRKDGTEFPIDATLSPLETSEGTLIIVAIRDISERKRLEEALREQEAQYRAVVENASDGIGVMVDDKLAFVNSAFLRIYGVDDQSKVLGVAPWDLALPQHRDEIRERALATQRGDPSGDSLEFAIQRPDGAVRTVNVSVAPVPFSGKPGVMGIIRDVTERKRMEEELREANGRLQNTLQQLQEAQSLLIKQQRLNALGQMASGIVHDFNNALTPILGFSSLLIENPERLDNREAALRHIGICHAAAQDAAHIVGRLREFYRPRDQAEPFISLDINEVVQHAASVTQYVWAEKALAEGKTIAVTMDLKPIPMVKGNATELTEVLTNLIINGVDAMPGNGAIHLRTKAEGGHVLLQVEDTGSGMPEEVRQRCFEPFFTTKGDKGTGLGLAVTYGVVQRHNGRVEVDSRVGEGTTFTISLPSDG